VYSTRGGICAWTVRVSTPNVSSARRRSVSVLGLMPGRRSFSSPKRFVPVSSSRTISVDHRPSITCSVL